MMKAMPLSKTERLGLRTWIEVDTRALRHNYRVFRGVIPRGCRLMAVAKSNAYGHGLLEYAHAMEGIGVDWFGADSITEAVALRHGGIRKPILVLGYTLPERMREASAQRIALTISDIQNLRRLAATRKPIAIHLKVDTGMHRQGFSLNQLPLAFRILRKNPRIVLEGLYTHFAAAKNPAFPKETLAQLSRFSQAQALAHASGFRPLCHAAATSGALLYPDAHLDMVRVGIGLYGLWPSKEARAFCGDRITLQPALSWKAVVGEAKSVSRGARVGYDFTETLRRDSLLAVLPVGYWHGIPRALSGIGHALVRGRRAKIVGRVSMDMIVVDVTGIPGVRPGDEAILLGGSGKEIVSADELAYLSDTVNYEIVTRLNPLMRRFFL